MRDRYEYVVGLYCFKDLFDAQDSTSLDIFVGGNEIVHQLDVKFIPTDEVTIGVNNTGKLSNRAFYDEVNILDTFKTNASDYGEGYNDLEVPIYTYNVTYTPQDEDTSNYNRIKAFFEDAFGRAGEKLDITFTGESPNSGKSDYLTSTCGVTTGHEVVDENTYYDWVNIATEGFNSDDVSTAEDKDSMQYSITKDVFTDPDTGEVDITYSVGFSIFNTEPMRNLLVNVDEENNFSNLVVSFETKFNNLKRLDSKFVPSVADWNESNSESNAYIKNRTHYVSEDNQSPVGMPVDLDNEAVISENDTTQTEKPFTIYRTNFIYSSQEGDNYMFNILEELYRKVLSLYNSGVRVLNLRLQDSDDTSLILKCNILTKEVEVNQETYTYFILTADDENDPDAILNNTGSFQTDSASKGVLFILCGKYSPIN